MSQDMSQQIVNEIYYTIKEMDRDYFIGRTDGANLEYGVYVPLIIKENTPKEKVREYVQHAMKSIDREAAITGDKYFLEIRNQDSLYTICAIQEKAVRDHVKV